MPIRGEVSKKINYLFFILVALKNILNFFIKIKNHLFNQIWCFRVELLPLSPKFRNSFNFLKPTQLSLPNRKILQTHHLHHHLTQNKQEHFGERTSSTILINASTDDVKMQTQIINNGCNTFDRR